MVRGRTFAWTLVLSSATAPAFAQSLSIEEEKPAEPAPAPSPTPTPKPPAPPPVIVMPTARSTPLEYPEGAQGEASVALELTLTAEGDVAKAVVIEGGEPFASRAVEAAKAWKFQPATRDGTPIAAKIHYLVRFVPPQDLPEAAAEPAAPAAQPTPGKATPAKPAEQKPYEIVVIGERAPIRHELARTEISRMPGAFGDAFRAIEALPGVVPIISGLPYFYVRGAPPGNVGYFFDGIPVPFLYHFALGPSVFHPAFVDRVDLYPGAYPVRYGRFAGAIVAGEMAPPAYRLHGEWNIRLIDSGAMLEAPFANGRGSAMVGGRYSYTAAVLSLLAPNVSTGYWDYQGRARYDLNPHDSVEILGFGSGDYANYTEKVSVLDNQGGLREVERKHALVDVGFHRLDLRWDHRLEQGNWRNALMVGRDRTGFADGQVNVYDYMMGARSEYWKQLDPRLRLRAGADLLFESLKQEFTDQNNNVSQVPIASSPDPGALPPDATMMPGSMTPVPEPPTSPSPDGISNNQSSTQNDAERYGFGGRKDFSLGLYADVVWQVAPRVQITPGLRTDLFVSGSKAAIGLDPRITVEYQLSKKLKVVHGLAYVHQAPSFVGPVPGFKPSLAGGLQRAIQHSAGVNYELPAGFAGSVAVFQSAFFNMTDLISLIQLEQTADRGQNQNGNSDFSAFRTDGHAYGFELMVRRSLARKLGGFVTYTLSRSLRYAGRVSGPATTDRTHVLNVAASYDLGKNWRFGGRVVFYTGVPAEVAYLEAARHPPRTPAFWRLDVKLEKRWYIRRPDRWWGFNIEVLNTTLNEEQISGSCNAFACKYQGFGVPITVPIIGFEGAW
jgi:TonB family protein